MSFHKIIITTLILLCAHAPLLAGRGTTVTVCCIGSECHAGIDRCNDSYSVGGNGSTAAGNGGNGSGSSGSISQGSSTQSNQSRPSWAILKDTIEAECYVAPNGQICTKAQLITAAEELVRMSEGLAQGHTNVAISWLAKDIALRLFGIDTAPLGCAIATRAPAELCVTATRIQQLNAQIKHLEKEAKAIESNMNARVEQSRAAGAARIQRLKDAGLFH